MEEAFSLNYGSNTAFGVPDPNTQIVGGAPPASPNSWFGQLVDLAKTITGAVTQQKAAAIQINQQAATASTSQQTAKTWITGAVVIGAILLLIVILK